ncbi:MAG: hypothetical protein AAF420_01425 [Pseudomonadota bacterium]
MPPDVPNVPRINPARSDVLETRDDLDTFERPVRAIEANNRLNRPFRLRLQEFP